MLVHLSIQQLAIVEHLELELNPGMTTLTGETGAGKSILLHALGLALGDRADSDSVRHGAQRAEITACFDISQQPLAQQWLAEHELSSHECILRRSLLANGRSKAWINGQACPVQHLKELGERLIDIHGQHAHQSLLRKETHLPLLDSFAGLSDQANELATAFRRWRLTRQKLEQLKEQDAAHQARVQLLRYQVEELNQLALGEDELACLEEEQRELANAEQLIHSSQQALNLCDADEGAALQQVGQALQELACLDNKAIAQVRSLLGEAQIQLQEASHDLQLYISRVEMDPARLHWVEERLNSIYQTARKHHLPAEELFHHHHQLCQELTALDAGEGGLEQLTTELETQAAEYRELAEQLSQARQKAARKLEAAVAKQLAGLGMKKSKFHVSFKPVQGFQAQGKDDIEFLIAPNPGQPAKPLARIASGGELSRISLAIQVVTAETSQISTLVFDEVDVGISGAVAEIVGRLLKQLATRGQILCITHLPQVAAQGDQHLHIHKKNRANNTSTVIQQLDEQGRVQELARMLGGVKLSDSTLAHAREMLETSRQALH